MSRISKQITLIATLALVAGFVSTAKAGVIVDAAAGIALDTGTASSHTITSSDLNGFSALGSDKLIVTVTNERAGASDNTVSGITYGNVSLNFALSNVISSNSSSSVARKLSIWYLDNVTVTGELVVSYVSAASGIGLSAVAVTGTAPGFVDDNTNGSVTTTDNGIVVAAAIANGGTITADAPLVQTLSSADGSTGSSTGAAGYYVMPSAGTFTPSFSGDETFVAGAFNAIPEPASLTLLGLGGLLIASRPCKRA